MPACFMIAESSSAPRPPELLSGGPCAWSLGDQPRDPASVFATPLEITARAFPRIEFVALFACPLSAALAHYSPGRLQMFKHHAPADGMAATMSEKPDRLDPTVLAVFCATRKHRVFMTDIFISRPGAFESARAPSAEQIISSETCLSASGLPGSICAYQIGHSVPGLAGLEGTALPLRRLQAPRFGRHLNIQAPSMACGMDMRRHAEFHARCSIRQIVQPLILSVHAKARCETLSVHDIDTDVLTSSRDGMSSFSIQQSCAPIRCNVEWYMSIARTGRSRIQNGHWLSISQWQGIQTMRP